MNVIGADTVAVAVLCAVNWPRTLAGAQSVVNAFWPFGPVTFSARLVSGRSGTSANVTVPAARFT